MQLSAAWARLASTFTAGGQEHGGPEGPGKVRARRGPHASASAAPQPRAGQQGEPAGTQTGVPTPAMQELQCRA